MSVATTADINFRGRAREAPARRSGLAEGASILTPLAPAAFAPLCEMLTDRFGVTWIVDVASS